MKMKESGSASRTASVRSDRSTAEQSLSVLHTPD